MEKSYILQIHTGSFLNAHTTFEKIKEKIDFMIKNKPVSAVIFGWNLDRKTNRELLCYFRQFSIPCYFWLPVLSEIDQIKSAVSITNYTGKDVYKRQEVHNENRTIQKTKRQFAIISKTITMQTVWFFHAMLLFSE